MLDICILAASMSIFVLAPLLVWPARWQIIAWMQVPFALTAYWAAVLIVDYRDYVSDEVFKLIVTINAAGAIAFLVGVYSATKVHIPIPAMQKLWLCYPEDNLVWSRIVLRKSRTLMWGAVVGIYVAYAKMGFMPIFANDPLTAKFFRGEYPAAYDPVAPLFRFSHMTITAILPMVLVGWIKNRKLSDAILILLALFALVASLTRAGIGQAVAEVIGIYAAIKGRWFFPLFCCIYFIIFGLGSFLWVLAGIMPNGDFWRNLVSGVPDYTDQLTFMSGFEVNSIYTYGRTFLGGLIPYRYEWNPAVYTLRVINGEGADINEIASGGVRLPPAIWGYVSFEWLGVLCLPLLSGLFTGAFVKYQKKVVRPEPVTLAAIITAHSIIHVFTDFFVISLYLLVPAGIAYYCLRVRAVSPRASPSGVPIRALNRAVR